LTGGIVVRAKTIITRTVAILLLLLTVRPIVAQEPKLPELSPEEQKLADEATKLIGQGQQLYQRGRTAEAIVLVRQALEVRQKAFPASKYPDGHPELGSSYAWMALMLKEMGQMEKAVAYSQLALDMNRKLFPASKYPDGHPDLAVSLNQMGFMLHTMGQAEKALTFYRESLEMLRKLYPASKYPDGHPQLAVSINNLGFVLESMGQPEKALPYLRESLAMRRKLFPPSKYPDGHSELADSISGIGFVLISMGQLEKALPYYRQSLAMRQRLFPASKFPNGHPQLALSLNNMGFLLQAMGQPEKALPFLQQTLEMRRKLFPPSKYPDGHAQLALSLNNLSMALQKVGQVEEASVFGQQAVEMFQRVFPESKYPDGHPRLAVSLHNEAVVLQKLGQTAKALPLCQQSLEMQRRILKRELLTASEQAAFDKVAAQPLDRDAYLSVTRALATPAESCYTAVWPSRSMVTRLLEQRHANTRAAGTAAGANLDELRANRRRTEQLLQDPRVDRAYRDAELIKLADERDAIERKLVADIPAIKRWQELDVLGPADLTKALPSGAVFIDFIRYTRFEYAEKNEKQTPSYVAFVLAKDRPIQRIELGEATRIDNAIRQWRAAIEVQRDDSSTAAELTRRVWNPIANAVPAGSKMLYLAPDGDLARLPWAALPVGKDRVLLEDYAIAQVPHGTFLLEQLKFPRTFSGPESLLTLGGVEYGPGVWPALPGTAVETKAIAELAPGNVEALSKTDATAARLTERLPQARFAHFATHGEFQAEALAAERKRAAEALASGQLGDDSRKIAAKNPLGYVGLVLANGEIMSGLSIVDLPLENLQLVTLSACETGLGAYTGGEGVQGLQRAFHLAGCPNVVASLWMVNDAATAALMAKFYYGLWVTKKPPIEALREAQLTVYRRPDLIPDLTGERGAPKLRHAVAVRAGAPRASDRKTSDTKLWAAFVLSGAGR
jgi:CHAT domain-containing protein